MAARQAVLPVSSFGSAANDSNIGNDSNGGSDSNGSDCGYGNVGGSGGNGSDGCGSDGGGSDGGCGSDGCGSDASCSPSVFGSAVRSLWKRQSSDEGNLTIMAARTCQDRGNNGQQ